MSPTAKLLVIERLIGAPNEDASTKFYDLTMLVHPGGRDRTLDEYTQLLEEAGFQTLGVSGPGADNFYIFEAKPS